MATGSTYRIIIIIIISEKTVGKKHAPFGNGTQANLYSPVCKIISLKWYRFFGGARSVMSECQEKP